MRMKKISCMVLSFLFLVSTIGVPVDAAEIENTTPKSSSVSYGISRATESFSITVPAKKTMSADTSFPMAAGETVTIQAYYSPDYANLDIGLVDPDGTFYYFNITNGHIDKTILIPENGRYTLQIRNNSDYNVEMAGFVKY